MVNTSTDSIMKRKTVMFKDHLGKSNKRNCLTQGHSFSLVRFCVRLHCTPCFFFASTANIVTLYILYYHFSFILKERKPGLPKKKSHEFVWKFTDTHTAQAQEQAQLILPLIFCQFYISKLFI